MQHNKRTRNFVMFFRQVLHATIFFSNDSFLNFLSPETYLNSFYLLQQFSAV